MHSKVIGDVLVLLITIVTLAQTVQAIAASTGLLPYFSAPLGQEGVRSTTSKRQGGKCNLEGRG